MLTRQRKLIFAFARSIFLALAASSCACSREESDARAQKAKSDTSAHARPTVALSASSSSLGAPLVMISGTELLQRVRDNRGRGVLINVWAAWCAPCRAELPLLQRVSTQLGALGVPVWLLSIDDEYALPVSKALLDSMHIDLPRMAAAPPLEALAATLDPDWPPGTVPASFLFDARGKLAAAWAGEVHEGELLLAVARLDATPQQ